MRGIAKVIVVGNLGRKPELKYTNSGKAVANLSVAVNSGRRGEETTEWIQVVVWEKTAENCAEYLDAGSAVYVEGRWQTKSWQDRDGNDRKTVEVVAYSVLFLGSAGDKPQGGSRDADGDGSIPF